MRVEPTKRLANYKKGKHYFKMESFSGGRYIKFMSLKEATRAVRSGEYKKFTLIPEIGR